MTRADARFEAERARASALRADELARLRRLSWEMAESRCAPAEDILLALEGAKLAERERDFFVSQALKYAELAQCRP